MDGDAPGRHSGTIACAVIGAVALVTCLLVLVLTDDDAGSAAGLGPHAPAQYGGGSDGSAGNGSKSAPGASCKGCAAPPTKAPGPFPYPPGTHRVHDWTDSFCTDDLEDGEIVRAAPMSFAAAKRWYVAHLPASGYTWDTSVGTTTYHGKPIGAGGPLSTSSDSDLWLEVEAGPAPGLRGICGPAYGEVYIHVRKE